MNCRLAAPKIRVGMAVAVMVVATSSCGDFLSVSDPGRFTDDALNTQQALLAVANGVEADLVQTVDNFAWTFGHMSDELIHTGTWNPDRDRDAGRDPNTLGGTGGFQGGLLQDRLAAQKAQERFTKVMGDTAARSLLMARVVAVEAWANLYMGMFNCESPKEPNGAIVSALDI
ncbi:MAG TPA: hypothetical protein VMN60_13480, partial [Longimicrobiales bacterium]|nr:hypothetical protein [Longimicrobiales bacterium]